MNRLKFDSYFLRTIATFKGCKIPKREPDYVSHDHYGNISSRYWYGVNSKGKYVIRCSDRWTIYKAFSNKFK